MSQGHRIAPAPDDAAIVGVKKQIRRVVFGCFRLVRIVVCGRILPRIRRKADLRSTEISERADSRVEKMVLRSGLGPGACHSSMPDLVAQPNNQRYPNGLRV